MTKFTPLAATLLWIGSTACAATPQVDLEAERAALRAAVDEYHRLAETKDVDGVMGLYDAAIITLPPCVGQVAGAEEMRTFAEMFTSTPGLEMSIGTSVVEVSKGGQMGYSIDIVSASMDGPDGGTVTVELRDVHVWRKQEDGSWKVVVDVWNSAAPLPCPEA